MAASSGLLEVPEKRRRLILLGEALGLTVPPSLLARADVMVE
jgi:hypothetical protein